VPVTSAPVRRSSLDPIPLAALAPGLVVEVLDETTSTNAVAADRAREGAPEGHVVVAEHQTAGRGRLDRTWETPARSALIFSMVLRPTAPPGDWPWLPLLTGYVVTRELRELGYDAGVKWPNDVLIEERKVAGILVERIETSTGPAAVVGVGLNVSLTPDELPVPTGTSLAIEAGAAPDRATLLASLLRALSEAYGAWQAGGPPATDRLRSSYAAACVTLGRDVRVELPGGRSLTGRATGIDAGGRLVVAGRDGATVVGAGDVVHVRPAPGGVEQ
jgi:BirA family biotin operon repressor/biotin-[acetyl-CoA-carboxylase] ligase